MIAMGHTRDLDLKLVAVCQQGLLHLAPSLLAQGASPQALTRKNVRLSIWAARHGKNNVINLLLDAGLNIHSPEGHGHQCEHQLIHIAAKNGQWTTCDLLLKRGANPNAIDNNGYTPLHACCGHAANDEPNKGKVNAARALIDAGADVNAKTKTDSTPLHGAAQARSIPMVALLLAHGADHAVKKRNGGKSIPEIIAEGDAHSAAQMGALIASSLALRAIDALMMEVSLNKGKQSNHEFH